MDLSQNRLLLQMLLKYCDFATMLNIHLLSDKYLKTSMDISLKLSANTLSCLREIQDKQGDTSQLIQYYGYLNELILRFSPAYKIPQLYSQPLSQLQAFSLQCSRLQFHELFLKSLQAIVSDPDAYIKSINVRFTDVIKQKSSLKDLKVTFDVKQTDDEWSQTLNKLERLIINVHIDDGFKLVLSQLTSLRILMLTVNFDQERFCDMPLMPKLEKLTINKLLITGLEILEILKKAPKLQELSVRTNEIDFKQRSQEILKFNLLKIELLTQKPLCVHFALLLLSVCDSLEYFSFQNTFQQIGREQINYKQILEKLSELKKQKMIKLCDDAKREESLPETQIIRTIQSFQKFQKVKSPQLQKQIIKNQSTLNLFSLQQFNQMFLDKQAIKQDLISKVPTVQWQKLHDSYSDADDTQLIENFGVRQFRLNSVKTLPKVQDLKNMAQIYQSSEESESLDAVSNFSEESEESEIGFSQDNFEQEIINETDKLRQSKVLLSRQESKNLTKSANLSQTLIHRRNSLIAQNVQEKCTPYEKNKLKNWQIAQAVHQETVDIYTKQINKVELDSEEDQNLESTRGSMDVNAITTIDQNSRFYKMMNKTEKIEGRTLIAQLFQEQKVIRMDQSTNKSTNTKNSLEQIKETTIKKFNENKQPSIAKSEMESTNISQLQSEELSSSQLTHVSQTRISEANNDKSSKMAAKIAQRQQNFHAVYNAHEDYAEKQKIFKEVLKTKRSTSMPIKTKQKKPELPLSKDQIEIRQKFTNVMKVAEYYQIYIINKIFGFAAVGFILIRF
ncbi:Hypothetical_protein [Hexamita inflata]|uniref:Hypothetical_protein n=1 Tax=Hexamita inflata TaxID=28002 RepID=A0AA86R538_9EUKA|nr:Hypothetical protein HINF_LOCUS58370 [Hexamita inflata]